MATNPRRLASVAILATVLMVSSACGVGNKVISAIDGGITEHRMPDGVRCYESQSGSVSCVVVR